MSDGTGIEWAGASWNPMVGCSPCSPGCDHCYAARMAHRLGSNPLTPQYQGLTSPFPFVCDPTSHPFNGTIRFVPEALAALKKWRQPRRVFVCSMGDLFAPQPDYMKVQEVLNAMRESPHHTYLLLTKRPQRMAEALALNGPIPDNWHVGVTVCNQQEVEEKLPVLLSIPAKVRWASVEPMLGPMDMGHGSMLGGDNFLCRGLQWVVCGGETGPGARPVDPRWVVDLYGQCQASRVPFFAKKFLKWTGRDGLGLQDNLDLGDALATRQLPEEGR